MRGMSPLAVARWSFVAFGLAASVSIAGCGATPGESVGQTSEDVTFANDKAAFDYFLGKGLSNFQAAGIVGNLDQESGVDPTAVQSGGPGRGIAQWSVGGRWDTDANDNATSYAGQEGQSVDSLQLQLDFIWYELTTFSSYGLAALKASTNVTDATIAFQDDFEGCGTCDQSTRVAYAENVLSVYGNDTVDGGGSSTDAGSGAPSCTVPGVGTGVCILTSDCTAMPGHVSTPGYCPGPANEECCTGPSEDGGMPTDAGGMPTDASGQPTGGDSGSGSSGSGSGSSSGSSSSGSSGAGTHDASTGAGDAAGPSSSGSNGCSTAPGGASGSSAGYWLTGLAWIAARRRKRAPSSLQLRQPSPFS
jgi:MYXO-CTERM domain-containing protein